MAIYRTETMGDFNISERTHKAKKNHTCAVCEKTVEKGTVYVKTVGTFDGYFVSESWHKECHDNHVGYVKDQQRKQ